MSESSITDLIAVASYLSSEFIVYPISSAVTKVQASFVNQNALQRSFSSYAGANSIAFSIPGFLLRLKLSNICDPYFKNELHFSQFTTYVIVSSLADFCNVIIRAPAEHYRQQFQIGAYTSYMKFYRDYIGYMGPFSF